MGVIGAGQMGRGMIAQIASIPRMIVTGISDLSLDYAQKAKEAYLASAKVKNDVLISTDAKEIIHSDWNEVIVDATGYLKQEQKLRLKRY